jgi:hypothetical protein
MHANLLSFNEHLLMIRTKRAKPCLMYLLDDSNLRQDSMPDGKTERHVLQDASGCLLIQNDV